MNERILLSFAIEDSPVAVTYAHPSEGIILGSETDAFPIAGGLSIFPANDPISQNAFKRICSNEDWRDGKFRVRVSHAGGKLVISGGGNRQPEANLPPIGYRLEVRMKNTRLAKSVWEFRLPKNGVHEIPLRVTEPKRVQFAGLDQYDDETKAIVSGSQLDGVAVPEWLRQPAVRTARKICLLNCLAHLRKLPSVKDTLSADIRAVRLADIDRIGASVGAGFLSRMRELTKGTEPVFGEDSGPVHPTHERTRKRLAGSKADGYQLHSFRQRTSQISMQIVVMEPADTQDPQFAEIDIDLGNPFVDVVGFGTHLFELIDPAATDHFALGPRMESDFRYYSFEDGQAKRAGKT